MKSSFLDSSNIKSVINVKVWFQNISIKTFVLSITSRNCKLNNLEYLFKYCYRSLDNEPNEYPYVHTNHIYMQKSDAD